MTRSISNDRNKRSGFLPLTRHNVFFRPEHLCVLCIRTRVVPTRGTEEKKKRIHILLLLLL